MEQDVVLYDGKCTFCTRSVRQLQCFDGKNRLRFVSIHDPMVSAQYPDLTMEMLMEQMYVVPHDHPNQRFGGAEALRYLSRRLPRLWFAAPFLHIPFSLPVWKFLYRQVATRRYRLAAREHSCETGTCDLHYPERK